MELHLLHPAAVHFPVALLTAGLAAAAGEGRGPESSWLRPAATWSLLLGTASTAVAFGLGVLAERTAPHVPPAWRTLVRHEDLAWWSVGLFVGLSTWRLGMLRRGRSPSQGEKSAFLAAWLLSWGVLAATAWLGGELVFRFGVGVLPPE